MFWSPAMRSIILALLAVVLVVTHAKKKDSFQYPGGLRDPPEMFIEEIVGRLVPEIIKYQTPLAVWRTWRIDQALWNCVAHFHGSAFDAITKARPVPVASNELFTSESRALCMVYAMNKLIPELVPGSTPVIVDFLAEHGLETAIMTDEEAFAVAGCNGRCKAGDCRTSWCNTLDDDEDSDSPRVIGSIVAANVIAAMQTDGWNHKGQLKYDKATGEQKPCSKNCSPFQDPTGYKPKNSAWAIDPAFPTRWQPLQEDDGFGYHFVQEHIVPYIGTEAEPAVLSRQELSNKKLDPPVYDYEHETTLVLQRAATLAGSDEQKLMVELMNNKLNLVAGLLVHIREKLSLSLEAQVFFSLGMTSAEVDATLLAWKEKVSHDLIRPTSLIHQKGAESVESYAGPVEADEWRTYVPVMPHSEYPSGSACLCEAVQEYTDLFVQAHGCIDDDDLLDDGKWTCADYEEYGDCEGGAAGPNWDPSWGPLSDYKADEACCACGRGQFDDFRISTVTPTYVFAAGSSQVQPGQVPGNEVVKTFTSMSEVRDVCGESRLWGGMHFTAAVADGMELCDGVGAASLGRMEELLGGGSFMDLMDAHKWKYGRAKPKTPTDNDARRRAGTEEAKAEDEAMPNQLPSKQARREARARQRLAKEALSSPASPPRPAADFFVPGAFLLGLAMTCVGVHARWRSSGALPPSLDRTDSSSHQLLATEGSNAETEAHVEAEARPVTVAAGDSRRRSSASAALEHLSSLEGGGSFLRIRSAGLSRA